VARSAPVPPRSDISALSKYHSAQVDVAVRLNTNESPFPPPGRWRDEVARLVATIDWNRYPDREARALRRVIADRHGVDMSSVFVANGSNEVLQTVLLSYAGAGRTVAVFEPTYQLHAHLARISGATVVAGRRSSDFTLSSDEIRRVVNEHSPHVTFLCSPNNPTGRVEAWDNIELLTDISSGLVVIDEAYAEFSERSAVELAARPGGNVVVSRTFSKTWSLAGLRLGYVIAPPEIVDMLHAVVLPYHLDSFKQAAGLAALGYVDEMNDRVARIVAERDRITESLSGLDVDTWPSGANFVLFKPRRMSGHTVWQALVDRGVLVRDCSSWSGVEDCLRVTVGTEDENSSFIEALKQALEQSE
jgi:histidinol-phosphate aminotransferase